MYNRLTSWLVHLYPKEELGDKNVSVGEGFESQEPEERAELQQSAEAIQPCKLAVHENH